MLYSKNGGEYMAKILIVEDDKRTNMAICEYLKPTGHNIVSAYDGEEALQLFNCFRYYASTINRNCCFT